MGFKVELKMQLNNEYSSLIRTQISEAITQFVEQYGADVVECDIQILPDRETIILVEPREEPTPRDNNLEE